MTANWCSVDRQRRVVGVIWARSHSRRSVWPKSRRREGATFHCFSKNIGEVGAWNWEDEEEEEGEVDGGLPFCVQGCGGNEYTVG